jgi:hypothetical protein
VSASKVKLRPAVHYAPVDDGLYVAGWADSFVVKGPPSLFKLVEAIAPALERGVVEDELVQSLPDGAPRKVTSQLLDELRSRDMLLVVDALSVREVPSPLDEQFADTIAHLESVSRDPYAAFLRFRDTQVLFVGAGDGLARAVEAMARMGLAHATVRDADADTEGPALPVPIAPSLDLVVHVEPSADRDRLAAMASAAAEAGVAIVQAIATHTTGLVCGGAAGGAQPTMVDVLDRLALRVSRQLDVPRVDGAPSALTSALVGNLAAHRAFEHLAGVAGDGPASVAVVDADTLGVTTHPFVLTAPAPVAVTTAAAEGDGERGEVDVDAAVDDVLDATNDVADAVFGVFGEPSVRGLSQSPVFASAIHLGPSREAFGAGFSEGESRFRAVVEAVRETVPSVDPWPVLAASRWRGSGDVELPRAACRVAVGLDADAFVLDGIGRHLLTGWVERAGDGQPLSYGDVDDAVSHMCWKALALRFGRDVSVVATRPLPTAELWLGAVMEGGAVASACYGLSETQAVRSALTAMVGMAQTGRDDERCLPYLGGWPQGPPVHGLFDGEEPAKPAQVLDAVEAALDPRVQVAVRRLDAHPLVARLGVVAGWVGMSDAR